MQGLCGGLLEVGFPSYVWPNALSILAPSVGGRYFEGRLTNQALGEVKENRTTQHRSLTRHSRNQSRQIDADTSLRKESCDLRSSAANFFV